MTEKFKCKRVVFKNGAQRKFIKNAKKSLHLNNKELAKLLKVTNRTLSDWKREKFYIPLDAVKILLRKERRSMPKNIKIREPFWYVNKGAKIGGLAVYRKYGIVGGNPEKRKEKWFEWWNQIGKFKKHPILNKPLPIKRPNYSEELAEFVGIVIGDGGISKRQLTVTLHHKDDKKYTEFVVNLIKKLFSVKPSIYHNYKNSVNNIVVSRSELVKFCAEKLGLKIGNKIKQQVDIPDWIKKNKKFQVACLRGLIDTDGSIIIHKYKSKNKFYSYKKIGFTTKSYPLLKSASNILDRLGIKYGISKRGDVRIESQKNVEKYLNLVNSHNPKHLERYYK